MRLPSEPVKNTCPDINKLQKTIKDIQSDFASFKDTDDVNDFLESMSNASWELRNIYDILEELRSANSALRDWGHELTSLAEQMESGKDIEIDDVITYKGTTYKVEYVDEYIVKMRSIEDDILIEVNSNMIKNAIKKGRY